MAKQAVKTKRKSKRAKRKRHTPVAAKRAKAKAARDRLAAVEAGRELPKYLHEPDSNLRRVMNYAVQDARLRGPAGEAALHSRLSELEDSMVALAIESDDVGVKMRVHRQILQHGKLERVAKGDELHFAASVGDSTAAEEMVAASSGQQAKLTPEQSSRLIAEAMLLISQE